MHLDFGKAAKDFGKYRVGFPAPFFERLEKMGIIKAGQRVLDLGVGTGLMARELAKRGCDVTGLDKSALMLAEAKQLDGSAGVEISYVRALAEHTGFRDKSFDLATAGQCWNWFDQGMVLVELRRLLKPGGHLVIANLDWLRLPNAVCCATEQLIKWHNPGWSLRFEHGLHPNWLLEIDLAGFRDIETFSFDVNIPYSHEDWRGRIRASGAVGAYLPPDKVKEFDNDLQELLANKFTDEPLQIQHRMFAITCRA